MTGGVGIGPHAGTQRSLISRVVRAYSGFFRSK